MLENTRLIFYRFSLDTSNAKAGTKVAGKKAT